MKHEGLTIYQVTQNRRRYGDNRLTHWESAGFFEILKKNFGNYFFETSKLVFITIVAEVVYYVCNFMGVKSPDASIPFIMLMMIFVVQAIQSLYYCIALKCNKDVIKEVKDACDESAKVKVYHEGEIKNVSISSLVCGDYVFLETGDKIPADGILVDGNIKVNQYRLSGFNGDTEKKVHKGHYTDEENNWYSNTKCFRGSIVTDGTATMKVMAVGKNTALDAANLSKIRIIAGRKKYVSLLEEKYGYITKKIFTLCYLIICVIGIFI